MCTLYCTLYSVVTKALRIVSHFDINVKDVVATMENDMCHVRKINKNHGRAICICLRLLRDPLMRSKSFNP